LCCSFWGEINDEKEVNQLLCSTPSYVNSEGEKELLDNMFAWRCYLCSFNTNWNHILLPDQWCDNSYNVEHDGL